MVARRARREKARVLRGWRRFHAKRNNRRAAKKGGAPAAATALGSNTDAGASGSSTGGSEASNGSSSAATTSGGSSSRSSRGLSGSPSSSSSSSRQAFLDINVAAARRPSDGGWPYYPSHPHRRHSFPVPSASEAAQAGRANFRECLRAQTERVVSGPRPPEGTLWPERFKICNPV